MAANREGPERIKAEEALRCYTEGSAYAEFMEDRKGMLAPGMLADFAVLSQDITSIPRERIGDTRIVETVVGGRSVYRAAAAGRDYENPAFARGEAAMQIRGRRFRSN